MPKIRPEERLAQVLIAAIKTENDKIGKLFLIETIALECSHKMLQAMVRQTMCVFDVQKPKIDKLI